jgi:hypothetical protein
VTVFIREYDPEPRFELADVVSPQSCIPSSRHFDLLHLLIVPAERWSSAAAEAGRGAELRKTVMAPAVSCNDLFGPLWLQFGSRPEWH